MNASQFSATVDFFRETLTSPNTGWSILVRLLKSINTSCRTEKASCSRVTEVVQLHKLAHYANHCRPDAGPLLMEHLSAAPVIIKHGVRSVFLLKLSYVISTSKNIDIFMHCLILDLHLQMDNTLVVIWSVSLSFRFPKMLLM